MTTPDRLMHLLGRDLRSTPAVIDVRTGTPQVEPSETPRRYSWEGAKLTEADVYRESVVLDELADLTARRDDPKAAALELFGNHRP